MHCLIHKAERRRGNKTFTTPAFRVSAFCTSCVHFLPVDLLKGQGFRAGRARAVGWNRGSVSLLSLQSLAGLLGELEA